MKRLGKIEIYSRNNDLYKIEGKLRVKQFKYFRVTYGLLRCTVRRIKYHVIGISTYNENTSLKPGNTVIGSIEMGDSVLEVLLNNRKADAMCIKSVWSLYLMAVISASILYKNIVIFLIGLLGLLLGLYIFDITHTIRIKESKGFISELVQDKEYIINIGKEGYDFEAGLEKGDVLVVDSSACHRNFKWLW